MSAENGMVIVCNDCGVPIRVGNVCADCALKAWTK